MRKLLSIAVTCCVVGRLTLVAPLAQQPTPGSAPPVVDEPTHKAIVDLKRQAFVAEQAKDLKKEQALHLKILDLDPTDFLARQRLKEIQTALDSASEAVVNTRTAEARRTLLSESVAAAEQALIEAKTTRAREPLERAVKLAGEARRMTTAGVGNVDNLQERLDSLQAQIDQELASRNLRFWELWGVAGGLVIVGLAALVFYFRRTGRLLEMIEGPQVGQTFVLQKEATALGALASEVDWTIEDPLRKISRRHCEVLRQGRHYFLVDCSTNGTLLNGRPIAKGQPALLRRGDQIDLGGEVTLRFR